MNHGTTRFRKAAVGALASLTALVGLASLATPASSTANFTSTRIFGTDRYGTAAEVAKATFPNGATDVLLATGERFPDALAGNFLAGVRSAPILLTQINSLPQVTRQALSDLKVKNVHILGGTQAVSAGVASTISGLTSTSAQGGNITVQRYGGADRYETARLVAAAGATAGSLNAKKTAILATGDKFADALSGGPVAYAGPFPVLLTPGAPSTTLNSNAQQAITSLGIQHVLILGGNLAITDAVETQVKNIGGTNAITTQRLQGTDRLGTATAIADFAISSMGFSNSHINLARADDPNGFADALTGGPHGGVDKAAIVLASTPSTLGETTRSWVAGKASTLTSGHVFGGTAAISDAVKTEFDNAAKGGGAVGTLNITPTTSSAATQSATANRQFTVSGLTGNVSVALFQCENVTTSGGTTTLTQTAPNSGVASQGTPGATITVVNGSPAPANSIIVNNATPSSGTVNFTVQSPAGPNAAPVCVIPIVFTDTNNNGTLDVNPTTGAPTEPFGVGGVTQFNPAAATAGAFAASTVASDDKANDTFVACIAAVCSTYKYDSNDVFQIGGTNVTLATFEAALSPSDTVTGTYATEAGASSTFNLTDVAPAAPTGVTAAPTAGTPTTSVTVTWTESATPTTDSYQVFRAAATATGTPPVISCPNFDTAGATGRDLYTQVGTVADTTPATAAGATYTFNNTGLTPNTNYCFVVVSVDDGDTSTGAPTAPVTPTLTSGTPANPGAPTLTDTRAITDAGAAGVVDTGDVHRFIFNQPIAHVAGVVTGSYTVQDADLTVGSITCGGNATCAANTASVVIGANTYAAGRVVTVTLTGAPTAVGGGNSVLQYPATITAMTGFADVDEGLSPSLTTGDKTLDVAPATGP